ncbi:hypothetical protein [Rubinisphaera margarita]|uniref:hypothetical protein n=1 Tax=Rubinisphaera margarita TaxID=2909586 RepID=UPI001EE8D0B2|nr:hypothetical protein [Rubinisphaera margarita]MCG6158239.1 hypothetical protein [Rubinisphaera margarita]
MRFCLLPLLIFSILACPFRCMSAMASQGNSAESEARQSCSCCGQKNPDETPNAPQDEESCPNCLCHGAVVGGEEIDLDLDEFIDFLASLELMVCLQQIAGDSLESWDEFPPARSLSGYSICIQHQLLLI